MRTGCEAFGQTSQKIAPRPWVEPSVGTLDEAGGANYLRAAANCSVHVMAESRNGVIENSHRLDSVTGFVDPCESRKMRKLGSFVTDIVPFWG